MNQSVQVPQTTCLSSGGQAYAGTPTSLLCQGVGFWAVGTRSDALDDPKRDQDHKQEKYAHIPPGRRRLRTSAVHSTEFRGTRWYGTRFGPLTTLNPRQNGAAIISASHVWDWTFHDAPLRDDVKPEKCLPPLIFFALPTPRVSLPAGVCKPNISVLA